MKRTHGAQLLHLQLLDLGSDLLIYELNLLARLVKSFARQKLQDVSPLLFLW